MLEGWDPKKTTEFMAAGYNNATVQTHRSPARTAAQPLQAPSASPLPSQSMQQPHYQQTNGPPTQSQPTLAPQHEYRMPSHTTSVVSLPPIQHFESAQSTAPSQSHYAHTVPPNGEPPQLAYQYHTVSTPAGHLVYHARDGYTDRRFTPPPVHSYQPHILPNNPLHLREMSGGRHKKEIKRRTKTGCLTCRKRRIKCDERQPGCRNCEKSKRECLGYDPIFKQQSGPASIQPAPSPMPPLPKTDNPMAMIYPQPTTYHGDHDMHRGPPQTAPTNGTYPAHAYAQPPLGNAPGNTSTLQHYHQPFETLPKTEPQQSKV